MENRVAYLFGLGGVRLVVFGVYLTVGYWRLRRSSKNLREMT